MSRARKLANLLERAIDGPMWHGPALAELLDGVSPGPAAATPIPTAHSIWEIVRHMTVWADIAARRLTGPVGDPAPADDWPPVDEATPEAWAHAASDLRRSYRTLADQTRRLDEAQLDANVPGQEYSVATMLHGVVEHSTYHGGQIALLQKL